MVLVDTSVWVAHLRRGDPRLETLLLDGEVACHPFIIGELACGAVKNRREVLALLQALPATRVAEPDELLLFVERQRLVRWKLGLIDAHLLAAARLTQTPLWTFERGVRAAAAALNIAYQHGA